jgi:hypothetical protein
LAVALAVPSMLPPMPMPVMTMTMPASMVCLTAWSKA